MSSAYRCEVVTCGKFVAGEAKTVSFFDGEVEEIHEVCDECFAKLKQPFAPTPSESPAPEPVPAAH